MRPAFDDNMHMRLRLFWRHLSVLDETRAHDLADVFDTAPLHQLWGCWSDLDADHIRHLAEGFDTEAEPYRFRPLNRAA